MPHRRFWARRCADREGRYAAQIGLLPEGKAEYLQVHAAVWPDVPSLITACNFGTFSICLKDPENLIFSDFDDHGTDHAADAKIQDWWAGRDEVFPCDRRQRATIFLRKISASNLCGPSKIFDHHDPVTTVVRAGKGNERAARPFGKATFLIKTDGPEIGAFNL